MRRLRRGPARDSCQSSITSCWNLLDERNNVQNVVRNARPKLTPDPLANPVRLAIVRRLRAGSATLDELAEAAAVHRNTARSHAEALQRAELIERAPAEVGGAGRPATRFRLRAGVDPDAPPPLARMLGGALTDSRISGPQARGAARLRAAATKRLAPPKRRRARVLEERLSELGFDATVSSRQIELDGCPCPVVAPEDPALVCALITGTVDGTLEWMGCAERVTAAEHDPAARRCTLRLGTPDQRRPDPR